MQFRKYGVEQLQNIVITQGQMCGECLHSWTCLSLFFGAVILKIMCRTKVRYFSSQFIFYLETFRNISRKSC